MDVVLPAEAPQPRLCLMIKRPDFHGYGFNLHAEKSKPGQFIGTVDEGSPAEMCGLKEGDRIVEVSDFWVCVCVCVDGITFVFSGTWVQFPEHTLKVFFKERPWEVEGREVVAFRLDHILS